MPTIKAAYTDARVDFSQRFRFLAKSKGLLHTDNLLKLESADLAAENQPSESVYAVEPTKRTTLIVPGLLGSSVRTLVAPLFCAKQKLTVKGYKLKVAWVSGRSGCNHNAEKLREHVLTIADRSGLPVNIIGYSKGCADAIHMLGNYGDTHQAVASLVSYAGVVLGTPLASSVPSWVNTVLRYTPLPGEAYGDGLAINDLQPSQRQQWLVDHPLPAGVRLASIVANPSSENVSRVLKSGYRKLSIIDEHNDSQVITTDAMLPNSELLAVVNADHWAIALPIAERHKLLAQLIVDKNAFPRDVLIQATIDHLSSTPLADA